MAMSNAVNVAVVGATGLVGGAVLEKLAQAQMNVGNVFALASDETEQQTVEYGGRHLTLHTLDQFDFSQVHLAIFCVPADVAQTYAPQATEAGCWVIDHSYSFRADEAVPLVVAGINPQDLALAERKIVACPDSSATPLAYLIDMLLPVGQIERMNLVAMRAVSDIGRQGVEELSKQSVALFNLKPLETKQFDKQIAFNVLAGNKSKQNASTYDLELSLQDEIQKVFHDPDIVINSTVTYVPVFFGHSLSVHLELSQTVTKEKVIELIKKSSRLIFCDDCPTVVTDAVQQEKIYIGHVRQDETWDSGLNLWLVADNIHSGAAINSVQVAEILVKDYL